MYQKSQGSKNQVNYDDDFSENLVEEKFENQINQLENLSRIVSPFQSMSNSILKEPTNSQCQCNDLDKSQKPGSYQIINLALTKQISQPINNCVPLLQQQVSKPIVENIILNSIQLSVEEEIEESIINFDQITNQLNTIENNIQENDCQSTLTQLMILYEKLLEEVNRNIQNELPYYKQSVYIVKVIVLISKIYKYVGDFNNSIVWLNVLKNKFKILDPNLLGKLLLELGNLYFLNYQIRESQSVLQEALICFEKFQWKSDIAKTLLHQARLHAWIKNFDVAKKLAYGAIALLREVYSNDESRLDFAYFILSEINYNEKSFDTALEFLDKTINIKISLLKTDINENLVESYNLVGLIYAQLHEPIKSYNYFLKAHKCIKLNTIQKAQILNNLSVIQSVLGQAENSQRCQTVANIIYSKFLTENHQFYQRLAMNSMISSS